MSDSETIVCETIVCEDIVSEIIAVRQTQAYASL